MTAVAAQSDPVPTGAAAGSAVARLLTVRGPNFSGRTQVLRRYCDTRAAGRVYLGPEVYNALSGLATTVRQEFELHSGTGVCSTQVPGELASLGMEHLLEQNPAYLSGGEQACVALLCAMALRPDYLAVDCALEQLDAQRLAQAVAMLQGEQGPRLSTMLADNRLDEWAGQLPFADVATLRQGPAPAPPVPPLSPQHILNLAAVTAPTIELCHLNAGYPNRPNVLRDVNLTLTPGTIFTLEGPNGSGKSTWAKCLCGVIRPSAGEIRFAGTPARPWKTPGKTVGYHLQNPDVGLFESTVALELGQTAAGVQAPRVQHVMDAFGLRAVASQNPLALPFPVRKRVSLAATIARDVPWLFLDEPTLGADRATITAMAELITNLAKTGHGIIAVSHSAAFLDMLGGRRLKMHDGRIL